MSATSINISSCKNEKQEIQNFLNLSLDTQTENSVVKDRDSHLSKLEELLKTLSLCHFMFLARQTDNGDWVIKQRHAAIMRQIVGKETQLK